MTLSLRHPGVRPMTLSFSAFPWVHPATACFAANREDDR